jgi:hypothetical protein
LASAGIAIHRNDQHISQGAGGRQAADVARVEQPLVNTTRRPLPLSRAVSRRSSSCETTIPIGLATSEFSRASASDAGFIHLITRAHSRDFPPVRPGGNDPRVSLSPLVGASYRVLTR